VFDMTYGVRVSLPPFFSSFHISPLHSSHIYLLVCFRLKHDTACMT
jgi:hypothetical protein